VRLVAVPTLETGNVFRKYEVGEQDEGFSTLDASVSNQINS